MHRAPAIRASAFVVLALVVSACTATAEPPPPAPGPRSPSASAVTPAPTPTVAEPVEVTVAFIEPLDGEEASDRVAPAFQAARLAFSNAELVGGLPVHVEVVAYDTGEDPARTAEVAAELAASPAVVAAIGAPGLIEQSALGDALDAAGVPWISLSGSGSGLAEGDWTGWRRLVADQRTQARVLAETVDDLKQSHRGVCLLGDGTTSSRSVLGTVAQALEAEILLRATLSEAQGEVAGASLSVAESGCDVVVWGGEGSAAAALRRRLVEDGLRRVAFVGSDRIRDAAYLEAVGPAGEGSLATCSCVDVSTSTDLAAQRFIQDYQSEFGLPPGPCAVEGWDAARMIVAALRTGEPTRDVVRSALEATTSFEGLAVVYRFGLSGDLLDPATLVRVSRVEGGRWVELTTAAPQR